jgi:hypothetical protein
MTSRRAPFSLAVLALALGASACGNYSNEDLEFMNAVPDRNDVSSDFPVTAALTNPNEAALAKETRDATTGFNGILDLILGMVEKIRSFEPTSRQPNERIWGPIPADKQPGWQWRFAMTRQPDLSFTWSFEIEPVGGGEADWVPLVSGAFQPSPGVRRGIGSFTLDTTALRAESFPFDAGLADVKTIIISYSTQAFPISVTAELEKFPNYPDLSAVNTTMFQYGAQADGSGAMTFSVTGDLIPLTPALETFQVTSRWLANGAGEATAAVTAGDDAGLSQTQCWNDAFNATYNDEPWATPAMTGDPSACPPIPAL